MFAKTSKIRKHFLVIVIILLSFSIFHCQQTADKIEQRKTKIVIMPPSVFSLKNFIYLVENKIIDVPNLELTVIYYSKAKYEFDKQTKFLNENNYPYIHLKKIDGELNQENLFSENSCSKHFYNIFKDSDGILFFGGDDISPSIYGQKTSFITSIMNPYRHYFELSFLFHLLGGKQNESFQPYLKENPNYVIYGFCLGMQSMNVATGGTMYQDIPSEIYGAKYVEDVFEMDLDKQHKNYWHDLFHIDDIMWDNFHKINFIGNSTFLKSTKLDTNKQYLVCSSHHQAVKELGKGFKVIATSLDGKVIEAIEHKKYENVLGVQFHPEFTELHDPDEKKYKRAPTDTMLISYFEILKKDGSLLFHQKFWEHFSNLFL